MNRRKFLQVSAFACAAPAINKMNSIATVNVNSCVPPGVYSWEEAESNPLDDFRKTAEEIIINGHIPRIY